MLLEKNYLLWLDYRKIKLKESEIRMSEAKKTTADALQELEASLQQLEKSVQDKSRTVARLKQSARTSIEKIDRLTAILSQAAK